MQSGRGAGGSLIRHIKWSLAGESKQPPVRQLPEGWINKGAIGATTIGPPLITVPASLDGNPELQGGAQAARGIGGTIISHIRWPLTGAVQSPDQK